MGFVSISDGGRAWFKRTAVWVTLCLLVPAAILARSKGFRIHSLASG